MSIDLDRFKTVARTLGIRRGHFAGVRMRYERVLLPAIRRRQPAKSGRVLCYHSVGTEEWGVNDVPAPLFKSQLELALGLGYRFVPAKTIAAGSFMVPSYSNVRTSAGTIRGAPVAAFTAMTSGASPPAESS